MDLHKILYTHVFTHFLEKYNLNNNNLNSITNKHNKSIS